jgi:hypothetical protein
VRSAEGAFNQGSEATLSESGFITTETQPGLQTYLVGAKQPKRVAVDVAGITLKHGVMR